MTRAVEPLADAAAEPGSGPSGGRRPPPSRSRLGRCPPGGVSSPDTAWSSGRRCTEGALRGVSMPRGVSLQSFLQLPPVLPQVSSSVRVPLSFVYVLLSWEGPFGGVSFHPPSAGYTEGVSRFVNFHFDFVLKVMYVAGRQQSGEGTPGFQPLGCAS